MSEFNKNKDRLSDRILWALELALEQKDLELAESLNKSLEMSMTRNSGGSDFNERREYPANTEKMLGELRSLKGKS